MIAKQGEMYDVTSRLSTAAYRGLVVFITLQLSTLICPDLRHRPFHTDNYSNHCAQSGCHFFTSTTLVLLFPPAPGPPLTPTAT